MKPIGIRDFAQVNLPYVIPDCCDGKIRTIHSPRFWIQCAGGSCPVRRAEHVGAEYEESGGIEGFSWPEQRSPPALLNGLSSAFTNLRHRKTR